MTNYNNVYWRDFSTSDQILCPNKIRNNNKKVEMLLSKNNLKISWRDNKALNCYFIANDLVSFNASSAELCSKRCYYAENCTHYVHNNNGNICMFKTGKVCKSDAIYKESHMQTELA